MKLNIKENPNKTKSVGAGLVPAQPKRNTNSPNTQRGITLVALIITIIILLILAIVNIRLVINEGIISKVENGTQAYTEEEIGEQIKLAYSEFKMTNFLGEYANLSDFIEHKLESNYPEAIINCSGDNLILISVEKNSKKYEYFLNNDGNVTNKSKVEIIDFILTNENYEMVGIKREGDIIIPSFFTNNGKYYKIISIGEKAFQSCTQINKVEIPDSVTSIGNNAFRSSSVTNIGIPINVTNIGSNAFSGCTKLQAANFPNVTSIGPNAFWYAYIPSYNFPKLEIIGEGAFAECRKGGRLFFPKVIDIGAGSFSFAWGIGSVVLNSRANLRNKNAFRDGIIIYVNDEDLEWYSNETNWKDLYDSGKVKAISELNES